jgi:YHS domain-containing protein
MNLKILLTTAFLMIFLFSTGLAQEEKKLKKDEQVVKVEDKVGLGDETPVNTICPVSGEDIDGNIFSTYEGKTYALCCKSCLKKFEKDPEKYIERLSEDGKSLKGKK